MKTRFTMNGPCGKAALRLLTYSDMFSTHCLRATYGTYFFPGNPNSDISYSDCLTAQLDRLEWETNGIVSNAMHKAGLPITPDNWLALALKLRRYAITKEES